MALGSDLNLYLEDDYLLTPDALTMIDQWNTSDFGGVICLRRPDAAQHFPENIVTRLQSGLFGCGFAWRKDSWTGIRRAWFATDHDDRYTMWDLAVARQLRDTIQWRPTVNRSYGIGHIGTHSRSGADQNLFGPAYTGEPVTKFVFTP